MLVDDWDTSNVEPVDEEVKDSKDLNTSAAGVAENEVSMRDEFSYSLLDAIWMRRQTIDTTDE